MGVLEIAAAVVSEAAVHSRFRLPTSSYGCDFSVSVNAANDSGGLFSTFNTAFKLLRFNFDEFVSLSPVTYFFYFS